MITCAGMPAVSIHRAKPAEKKVLTKIVSTQSSGDPHFFRPTTFESELPLETFDPEPSHFLFMKA